MAYVNHRQNNGPIRNYDRFFNSVSAGRTLSAIRNIWQIQNKAGPKMIGLGTGTPSPVCFPFKRLNIETDDGRKFEMRGDELSTALGYTATFGYPPLVEWLTTFQKRLHDPPFARLEPDLLGLITVPGSEDAQCKIIEMILEPGDPILITAEAYPGLLSMLKPLEAQLLPVEVDEDGVIPESMEKRLQEFYGHGENGEVGDWKASSRRPKIFVIQPNHTNPTGSSTTLKRRQEIYRLACKYDLLLVEDDPYYFLTFSHQAELPSLQSLDTEGRVLRLDSFSKVLSAGMRVGYLSGPRPLVDRVMMHVACSSLHASTFSQAIIHRFLTERGADGYRSHCRSVAEFYEKRCCAMVKAAEKHLGGLAEWNKPSGGMFLWIKLLGVRDSRKMMEGKALEKMVMLAPGCYFMCDESKPTPYLRASFSWASEEEMDEGFRRLADMIKEEIRCSS